MKWGVVAVVVVLVIGAPIAWWMARPLFQDDVINEDLPFEITDVQTETDFDDLPAEVAEELERIKDMPDQTVSEEMPAEMQSGGVIERVGTFTGADAFHQGSGTAKILTSGGKSFVRFEEDFSVTNGPDLFIYFGNNGTYEAATNLGKLKGNKGAQNYEVPEHIDPTQYSEVWVWCRAFSVPFASAILR